MNPLALPPALSPDALLLLRYLLIAALLVYLPYLGIVIAGTAVSLVLNFFGRENRDERSLRLSRDWIETAAVNRAVLLLLGSLPYPAIAWLCLRILGVRNPLPMAALLFPFGVLLAGCLLLSYYRSSIGQPAELPPAPFRAGWIGLLSMVSGSFPLFLLLGALVHPAKLPLIRSHPVFILSWNSLAEFLLFLALSFGLAGGTALRLSGRSSAGRGDRDPGYEAYARSVGTSFALTGALALPPLAVLYLVTLPATGLSKEVFAMAAMVPILALVVFALLHLLPGKEEGRPEGRVIALFVLMFLAMILCDQAAVGNAFQGLSVPVGPPAAEKASRETRKMPAAEAAVLEKGKKVFETTCSACHRFDIKIVGPPYNEVVPKYKGNVEKLKEFIRSPVKVNPALPAMPKPALKEEEIDAVARYLISQVKGKK